MMPIGVTQRDMLLPSGTFHYLSATPRGNEKAPLVLCLHGFPDHPRSFGPLMARLVEAGYRVAAPWMRGYHPSTLDGPYHLDRIGLDVIEMAHALSPERPVCVVGHDWGAGAVYTALTDAPAQFVAGVVMAVPHPQIFFRYLLRSPTQMRRSWYMLFFQAKRLSGQVAAQGDFALIDKLWRDWSPGYTMPTADRAALHACLRASMPAPTSYYRALMQPPRQALARLRRGAQAPPITVPLLYLHGRDDGCIHHTVARGHTRYVSGPYERVVLEDVGHFLHLESPDLVAGHVIDWFQEFRSLMV